MPKIYLYVYSKNQKKIIFNLELAKYVKLEYTCEIIHNSLIIDLNKDNCLDIASYEWTQDYELPNEFADNITGYEKFFYIFKKNNYEYQYWDDNVLKQIELKK